MSRHFGAQMGTADLPNRSDANSSEKRGQLSPAPALTALSLCIFQVGLLVSRILPLGLFILALFSCPHWALSRWLLKDTNTKVFKHFVDFNTEEERP